MTRFQYRAYGLNIASEIELIELSVASVEHPDVSIVIRNDLPQKLEQPDDEGVFYQSTPAQTLLNIKNIGRYLVDSETIAVDPEAEADSIRLFLLEHALPVLLQRRGLLVLRASAVATSRGAVVFVSSSSCNGLSTLAAGLCFRGSRLLADTACAVTNTGEVLPAYAKLHLWKQSLEYLNIPLQDQPMARAGLRKFMIPAAFEERPQPILAIIFVKTPYICETKLTALMGVKRVRIMDHSLYFPQLVTHQTSEMAAGVLALASHTTAFMLDYDRGKEALVSSLDLIEQWIQA